jgi:hypothetical protein
MSNWKQQARKLIAQAELVEAIDLIESNGLKTGITKSKAQEMQENATQDEFAAITWKLIQLLGGTNKPMPELLK